ncbi:MAG: hypothetical protein KDB27_35085, partial [Planctomycetales bacterium]|nr:hypothetical protein [Planctomycetales bacterium]
MTAAKLKTRTSKNAASRHHATAVRAACRAYASHKQATSLTATTTQTCLPKSNDEPPRQFISSATR